jgi:large subunit ribosomal protein L13
MKTYVAKPAEVEKNWIVIDAEGLVVGRLASLIAMRLRGKHRADFTPHVDCGDHVVVVNADKVVYTGGKWEGKHFHWHTGYPGGIKSRSMAELRDGRFPERILHNAVRRMLPKESPLARKQLSSLRVYSGPEHPHTAQQPETIDVRGRSVKNTVRYG